MHSSVLLGYSGPWTQPISALVKVADKSEQTVFYPSRLWKKSDQVATLQQGFRRSANEEKPSEQSSMTRKTKAGADQLPDLPKHPAGGVSNLV